MNKKKFAAFMSAALAVTVTLGALAADNDGWTEAKYTQAAANGAWESWVTEWETSKNNLEHISLTPGTDESSLNFAWYSKADTQNVQFKFYEKGTEEKFADITSSDAITGYKSNKVTVNGLEGGKTYCYSYTVDGIWTDVREYTAKPTENGFSFVFFGDPQIGSSSGNTPLGENEENGQDNAVRNDAFNWNNTINTALKLNPNVSFMVSAGDQIQTRDKKATDESSLTYAKNEIEYTGYLSPDALKTLPVATTIGNHDAFSKNYTYHFNNPNLQNKGETYAGGDYYFTYSNTLFIMLNTNNLNIQEHKDVIEAAVKATSDKNIKWKVVTLHQDIYGSGEHSNEPEIVELRYSLIPVFEENGIDVVLTGHDHTYSRSFIMKGAQKSDEAMITDDEFGDYFDGKTEADDKYNNYLSSIEDSDSVMSAGCESVVNPNGILYLTANSASGSKFYDLVEHKQSYIAARWQEDVPTFSMIDITSDTFKINTYRTDTMEKIDDSFTIIKSDDAAYQQAYTINSFKIKTQNGDTLTEIPSNSFIAEASVTKNITSDNADYLIIASYDENGTLTGLNYSYSAMNQGSTLTLGSLITNKDGSVKSLKAYMWDGLNTMNPLAVNAAIK